MGGATPTIVPFNLFGAAGPPADGRTGAGGGSANGGGAATGGEDGTAPGGAGVCTLG
jgi:hypothetical protein